MSNNLSLSQFIVQRIRTIRKHKGISQEQLSELAGLESRYINKLENHKLNPTTSTLDKILTALEVSYPELFELEQTDEAITNLITYLSELSKTDRTRAVEAIISLLTIK